MDFDVKNLAWTRAPKEYEIRENEVVVTTEPHTDLWQRTYYGFRNDNAPVLQMETEEEFFSFLRKRQGILEAVCVSGGEPTLGGDLISFLNNIKKMGFLVKLDTNGYKPDVLKNAVSLGLCDYVAMDIKNSPDMYGITVGIENFDVKPIMESVDFLMSGKVDFEFRTTLTRELHQQNDIIEIGKWIKGPEKYFLQTFKDSGDLIASDFGGYDEKETKALLNLLLPYVPNAQIRG